MLMKINTRIVVTFTHITHHTQTALSTSDRGDVPLPSNMSDIGISDAACSSIIIATVSLACLLSGVIFVKFKAKSVMHGDESQTPTDSPSLDKQMSLRKGKARMIV